MIVILIGSYFVDSHNMLVRTDFPRESDASDSSHAPPTLSQSRNDLGNGSIDSLRRQSDHMYITSTKPGSIPLDHNTTDTLTLGLQEAIADANDRGVQQLHLDRAFVEAILTTLESRRTQFNELKSRFDGMKVVIIITPCCSLSLTI